MARAKRQEYNWQALKNLLWYLMGILLVVALLIGYDMYRKHFKSNVNLPFKKAGNIFIPTGSTVNDIFAILYKDNLIINHKTFEWLAAKKHLRNHIHPGHYVVKKGMSNEFLLRMLIAGRQEPIKVTFNHIRTRDELVERISKQIEASQSELVHVLTDEQLLSPLGFTRENIMVIFLPDTYEFYWNTSAEQFLIRMSKEFNKFWNDERKARAKEIGLSPVEVVILASIVDEETDKKDEESRIAGLYINRLKKGMRLEADPTVKFAIGNFSIKRILKKQTDFHSPYNTYLHDGIPPGPISLPSISTIQSVLNYQKHDYLYMCASDDFSGYHHFSRTLAQHMQYARQYQKLLNKKRIMK